MQVYNDELYKEFSMQNWETIYLLSREIQLLPNLRSIILTQNTWMSNQFFYQTRLPWLVLLISPSLRNLTTRVVNVQTPPVFSVAGAAYLLRSLVKTCPRLQSLDLFPTHKLQPFYQDQIFLSEVGEEYDGLNWFRHLSVLTDLQSVKITVPIPQQSGLEVLGGLPQLERLELTLLPEDSNQSQSILTLPSNAFPCLRYLALYRLPDLKFFRALWILGPMVADLDSIKIHFDKYLWPDLMCSQNLTDMVSLICKHSPCISDLAIYPPYEGNGNETSEIIYTLLSRLPLRRLCFAPVTPTILDIGYHITTYPLLQRLELPTPWTRLLDLRPLAQSLPNLNYLVLKLTISCQQWKDSKPDTTTPCCFQPIRLCVIDVFFDEESDIIELSEREIKK
jgi:hypothetical protein